MTQMRRFSADNFQVFIYVCTYTCCHSALKFWDFKKIPDEILEIEIRVVTKKVQYL